MSLKPRSAYNGLDPPEQQQQQQQQQRPGFDYLCDVNDVDTKYFRFSFVAVTLCLFPLLVCCGCEFMHYLYILDDSQSVNRIPLLVSLECSQARNVVVFCSSTRSKEIKAHITSLSFFSGIDTLVFVALLGSYSCTIIR